MTTIFYSDPHFHHQNIIKFCKRPYVRYDQMDEDLIAKYNSVVSDEDDVYCLGDFCFGNHGESYLSRLKGKNKFLVLGNHDQKYRAKYEEIFTEVYDVKLLNIKGMRPIWLSHYAHRTWPQSSHGSIHLFGHSHGNLSVDPVKELCMDVGVDCCGYYPLSIEKILKLMNIP